MDFWRKVYYKLRIGPFLSAIERMFWVPYKIMNARETIDYIIETSCSVARFGDGEFSIASYGCGLRFQKEDKNLQRRLIDVMRSKEPNLLLCLPNWINMVKKHEYEKLGQIQINGLKNNLHDWMRWFSRKRMYGDANITRLTDIENFGSRKEQVDYTKRIWENRDIILLEGSKTRFGVGNDLLDNASSVSRILGPAESAFDCITELLDVCEKESKRYQSPLILLALGPTATVMALALQQKGLQAIDIGHLDICYEVSLQNDLGGGVPVPRDHPVAGKYTSEADKGNIVGECTDPQYLSQIVYKCKECE